MSADDQATLTLSGDFLRSDSHIPGQARLLKALGLRGASPVLDPVTVLAFQRACSMYEEYLYVRVCDALQAVLRERRAFRRRRYVNISVDLHGEGAWDSPARGALVVPFHVAHYGFQPPTREGACNWTRRAAYSWSACGVGAHPFRSVQERLWHLGYALVDMSYIGVGARFRLYFRGPPSRHDYVQHVQLNYPRLAQEDIHERHWYWHGLHRIPAQLEDSIAAAACSSPGTGSGADASGKA